MAGSNYYADAAPAESAAPTTPEAAPPEAEEPEAQEEGMDESQTAELPKSVLGGKDFKPGEEVVLQVVQVMEDSVLVKYATGEDTSEEAAEPAASQSRTPTPGGSSPMSSLME